MQKPLRLFLQCDHDLWVAVTCTAHRYAGSKIEKSIIKASELKAQGKATDLLVDICKEVGATTYVSGPGQREGKNAYMEPEKFEQAGITLQTHEFEHPEYNQQFMHQEFVPYMCILDLLFNEGSKSIDIIKGA